MNQQRSFVLTLAFLSATALVARAHDGDPKLASRQPMYAGTGWRNAQLAQPTASGSIAASGVNFPHSNVTLLSWLSLPDFGVPAGGNGNSCFGYTSPSGREYAIMGLSTGTAFVEITRPGSPVIVAQIPGNQSLWRDMRAFSHYVYSVTENNGFLQVIDVGNIDNGVVTLVNTITTGGSGNTHTLALNADSGYLYRDGGSTNGLRIYDLNANPANPTYVGQWPDRYVHESQVVTYPTGGPGNGPRELAICCGGLNGGQVDTGIDIVDVTNKAAPVRLTHIAYPLPGYSHQAWLSPDRQFLYQNDETDQRAYTRVFDASQLNAPTPVLTYIGEFQNGTTVDHNLYTKGNLIYESNYRGGLRVFDRSQSSLAPTLYASFDTYPDAEGLGYNGLWNNYPYFQSGVVIGSDIEKGLFVWWVGPPQLSFTFPNGNPTTINPAGEAVTVQIDALAPAQVQPGTAKLWTSTGLGWSSSNLVALGGNRYSALFPAYACGTEIQYYVSAETPNGIVWTAPADAPTEYQITSAAFSVTTVVSDSFETARGWTTNIAGDTAIAGRWVRADPIGTTAQPEDDHTLGAGTTCWVTGNGVVGGLVTAADVDSGFTTLLSPAFDVTNLQQPTVSYWRWFSNDQGGAPNTDVFKVDISNDNGVSWFNVDLVGPTGSQTAGGWYRKSFLVADFVQPSAQVRLRFVAQDLGTDSVVEAAIDDFKIEDFGCSGARAFCAGDGSAAACPCGNNGATGVGCANSTGTGGALVWSGTPSVASDTFVLQTSGLPNNSSLLFFQGTTAQNSGLGTAFGDGLRCVSGSIVRLGSKTSSASGTSSYPQLGDATISVRGLLSAGATRAYQGWYRNAAAFCTSSTFNLTNGVSVLWAP